jgi:SPP1 family predicted phage head-tail adaptor
MKGWPRIDPGALRHQVFVQRADIERGAGGSEKKAWTDAFPIQVEFVSQVGREFSAAKAVNAELTHVLKTRWQAGISPDHRLRYPDPKQGGKDRFFDIRAVVNPDELQWILMIHCRELVGREAQS